MHFIVTRERGTHWNNVVSMREQLQRPGHAAFMKQPRPRSLVVLGGSRDIAGVTHDFRYRTLADSLVRRGALTSKVVLRTATLLHPSYLLAHIISEWCMMVKNFTRHEHSGDDREMSMCLTCGCEEPVRARRVVVPAEPGHLQPNELVLIATEDALDRAQGWIGWNGQALMS